jgi:DNA ligase (NAD+)
MYTDDEIIQFHKELCEKIRHHNHLYYVLGTPELTDNEYDQLYEQLLNLESQYNQILNLSFSPTQTIGHLPSKGHLVAHSYPMLSILNVNLEEWERFFRKTSHYESWVVQPKLDGMSVSASYINGQLYKLVTRGDGIYGEDITHNLKYVKNIPLSISLKENITIFGELVMELSNFRSLNIIKSFSTSRNTVAGTMRLKDSIHQEEKRIIHFYAFALEGASHLYTHYFESMLLLSNLTIPVVPYTQLISSSQEGLDYHNFIRMKLVEYDIDGIVCKVNANIARNLGCTAKYPRWMIAYKFHPQFGKTNIKQIDFNVGRSGTITPIAILNPINISGTTIEKVTLHNIRYVKENNLCVGDEVTINKSGDVIPYISSIHKLTTEKAILPSHCPSCQSQLVFLSTSDAKLVCNNGWLCNQQKIAKLKHFSSKNSFNIVGLSEKTIITLVENSIITYPQDIFLLTSQKLKQLKGFQKKKIDNLINSIDLSRDISLQSFIFSLGIDSVGFTAAKLIAKVLGTANQILLLNEYTKIEGITTHIKDHLIRFIKKDENRKIVKSLLNLCRVLKYVERTL